MQLTFNNEFSRSTLADGATAPWNTTFFGCLRNLITTLEQPEAELDQDDARQSSFQHTRFYHKVSGAKPYPSCSVD